jgi:hypothetical protein
MGPLPSIPGAVVIPWGVWISLTEPKLMYSPARWVSNAYVSTVVRPVTERGPAAEATDDLAIRVRLELLAYLEKVASGMGKT